MDFSQLFLYIPGVIIFLVGSGTVRSWMRLHTKGACADGVVVNSNHIVKKNAAGAVTYNYYNVFVEYTDPKTGKLRKENIKSPSEYAKGQPVKIYRESAKAEAVLVEAEDESVFSPWAVMIGGALMILLALFQNRGDEVRAMACLVILLIGAGVCMLWSYRSLKRRNLEPMEVEITEVFSRQISKETKILKGNKFTYYPVVTYDLNGNHIIRRCQINSSSEKEFKVGDKLTLYYDKDTGAVIENSAKISRLIWGIVLTVIGLVAAASMLPVLLG